MASLKKQFDAITLIKIFEMPVVNLKTGEDDYIVWNIEATEEKLIATASENLQKEIVSIDMDEDFSIDENLSELHDECFHSILEDEAWEHIED